MNKTINPVDNGWDVSEILKKLNGVLNRISSKDGDRIIEVLKSFSPPRLAIKLPEKEVGKAIEEITKINVDFISNKDGINLKDANHLSGALSYQLTRIVIDLFTKAIDEAQPVKSCSNCNGTSTVITDKSDYDMCPECNSPEKLKKELASKDVDVDGEWFNDRLKELLPKDRLNSFERNFIAYKLAQALAKLNTVECKHEVKNTDCTCVKCGKCLLDCSQEDKKECSNFTVDKECSGSVKNKKHWVKCKNHPGNTVDVREQQRINNLVLADKCDEMDKLAENHSKDVREILVTLKHARIFISTREKMHKTGIELYDELISKLDSQAKKEAPALIDDSSRGA